METKQLINQPWQGSSHPLTGPEPTLGISSKVVTGVIRYWTSSKSSTGRPFMDRGRLRAFPNSSSAKRGGKFLNLTRNQLRIMTGLLTGQSIFKDIKTGPGRQSWV